MGEPEQLRADLRRALDIGERAYVIGISLANQLEQVTTERDAARRLTVAVADRLVTVVECLSRVAERKDKRNK